MMIFCYESGKLIMTEACYESGNNDKFDNNKDKVCSLSRK